MATQALVRVQVRAPRDVEPIDIAQAIVGRHVLLKAEPRASWKDRPFTIWQPLQEMYEDVLRAYDRHVERMVSAIRKVMKVSSLEKAVKAPLTPKQVQEIARIIRDYHTAFIMHIGAGEALDKDEVARVTKLGLLPPDAMDIVNDSYLYGQLLASIREMGRKEDAKDFSYKKFREFVRKHPIPLSDEEKRAIEWSKYSAAVHVKGLGNRISDDFSRVVVEADALQRREYMGQIRTALQDNIQHRQTVRKLASELGHATEDWSRDLGRIAATEKQQAFQEGFAQGLIKHEGDPKGVYVAKIPKSDACPQCIRLHLTAGVGSKPRIFKLNELIQNGTNRGRKQADWRAVVGTVHPFCACEIIHVPPGWKFEDEPADKDTYKQAGKGAWVTKKAGKPWRPSLVPEPLRRGDVFGRDLVKALLTYGVPKEGCAIRVSDPTVRKEIEGVIAASPKEIFNDRVGVTLITYDYPRVGVPLDEHDLAYWTGNEIRISGHLPAEAVQLVLKHELGHSLNVYLINLLGSEAAVREWHDRLFELAKDEGYVSRYAEKLPIENAAEVTRLYLYERTRLMLDYPRQFTFVHTAYRGIWRKAIG